MNSFFQMKQKLEISVNVSRTQVVSHTIYEFFRS